MAFQLILILQKKVVRMMTNNDQYQQVPGPLIHSDPIFKELGILKIDDIFKSESWGRLFFLQLRWYENQLRVHPA